MGDKYADHGIHCSGIIAAVRNNGIGMDGIADNILIMPVRGANALRFGDERDKVLHWPFDTLLTMVQK